VALFFQKVAPNVRFPELVYLVTALLHKLCSTYSNIHSVTSIGHCIQSVL